MVEHFDGVQWANNGPGVITRTLKKICNTNDNLEMVGGSCRGFQVLAQNCCFAIEYPEHKKFFEEEYLIEVMDKINDSLIVHIWNKLSESTKLSVNTSVAYIRLAKQYCPKVIEACGEYF